MPRNKARRFLLNLDPVLAAAFYIGFMVIAVFTLALYANYLTDQVEKVQNDQNEKIIVAAISTCQRANDTRRAINERDDRIDEVLKKHVAEGNLPVSVTQVFLDIIAIERDLPIINCQRDIRTITGGLLDDVDEDK